MYILAVLPVAISGYMLIVNPLYLKLLYTTDMGRIMLASGACLLVAGFLLMRKVVSIDV